MSVPVSAPAVSHRTTTLVVIDEARKLGTLGKISLVRSKQMQLEYFLGLSELRKNPTPMSNKMIKVLDGTFQMLDRVFSQMDESPLELLSQFDTALIQQRNQMLIQAGVSSIDQLQKKQSHIATLQTQAKKLYYQSKDNTQTSALTDFNLLALTHQNSKKDQKIVQNFWDLIDNSPDGHHIMDRFEEAFSSSFGETMIDSCSTFFDNFPEVVTDYSPLKNIKSILSKIDQTAQSKMAEFLEKRANPRLPDHEAIQLDYLILQCRLKGPACMNIVKRLLVSQQLADQEQAFIGAVEGLQEHIKNRITSCERVITRRQEFLQGYPKCANKDAVEKDCEEMQKEIEKLRSRDPHQEIIQRLEMDAWRTLAPPETPTERVITSLVFGNELASLSNPQPSTISPEMRLPQSNLTADHFLTQMQTEASRKAETITKQLSSNQIQELD